MFYFLRRPNFQWSTGQLCWCANRGTLIILRCGYLYWLYSRGGEVQQHMKREVFFEIWSQTPTIYANCWTPNFKRQQNFVSSLQFYMLIDVEANSCGGGPGGWEPGSNGGGKSMGGGRREGRRWDTQGGGSREKQEINFATLHNFLQQKKHREVWTRGNGTGTGRTRYGKQEIHDPCPPSFIVFA